MPFYDYRCSKCQHTFEEQHRIADHNKPCKKPCPKCKAAKGAVEQVILQAPSACDPLRVGSIKPDNGLREVIAKIKQAHPRNTLKDY